MTTVTVVGQKTAIQSCGIIAKGEGALWTLSSPAERSSHEPAPVTAARVRQKTVIHAVRQKGGLGVGVVFGHPGIVLRTSKGRRNSQRVWVDILGRTRLHLQKLMTAVSYDSTWPPVASELPHSVTAGRSVDKCAVRAWRAVVAQPRYNRTLDVDHNQRSDRPVLYGLECFLAIG